MRPLYCERLGPWLIWIFAPLLTVGLLLSSINHSHGQDYWSSVFPAKPQWSQPAPSQDPYRPNSNVGYMSTVLSHGKYNPDGRSSDRNSASPRIQPGTMTALTGQHTVPGFFGGLSYGLRTDNRYNLEFYRLGIWHQLSELQLQVARTERLLLNVLAREADREQAGDDRTNMLLREWDDDTAQTRIDWERQCPGQAAWVRDHVQWYGPDSIEALTTRLQAVTDCPPGSS